MIDIKNKQVHTFKHLSLYTLLAVTPSLAYAAPVLEEIVVIARKTSESLQTIPVAVTALNEEMLIERQILQMVDLQRTAPNLTIGTGGTGPASIIYTSIRGQSQNSPNSVTDAAVGVYIDGVYLGRPIGSNMGFLDIAQAEILRGPQGTLFGRNTTGGALTIKSNRPNGDFGGHIKAEVGSYDLRHVEAVINIPLMGDELATRFAYRHNTRDGYVDNVLTGKDYQDVDESYSARASILYTPDDTPIEIFFSLDQEYYKDNGTPTAVVAYNDDFSAAPGFVPTTAGLFAMNGLNPRDYEQNSSNFYKTYGLVKSAVLDSQIMEPSNYHRATGATLDIEVDFGGAVLKSITGFRQSVSSNQNDLDGSPLDIIAFFSEYKQHQFSQELQLSGNIGDLSLIGGLYYFDEGGDEFATSHVFGAFIQPFIDVVPIDQLPLAYNSFFSQYGATSKGAFLQGNYSVTDKIRVTAGYRYTWDTKKVTRSPLANNIEQPLLPITCGLSAAELATLPFGGCSISDSASFSYPAYVLSVDYQITDDIFLYAKTSRASLAGNLNTRFVPQPFNAAVDPEEVTDFELGIKADFWDNRVRTNLAVFTLEGKGVQRIINAFSDGQLTQFNTNAGETEITGAEFELTALLWEGFELNASFAVMDGEYTSFSETRLDGSGQPIEVDRTDEDLPRTPEMTYSIGATQTFNLDVGELRAHIDYSYVDDQAIVTHTATPGAGAQAILDARLADKYSTIEAYGLINARISLTLNDPSIEIALWGRNLAEEKYITNGFDAWTSLGFSLNNQGAPRTYGASVTYRF